ncbi:cysteine desulfurase [Persicimonas caeni]|uniref:cysteine desulfurase n=1 Tax=Persicimonas caeni TaxID=2292766 RepID=A0A4Y6PVH4_PERCE|nr:cysteine desulfurase family protein [Persicimonas caeni]QDG51735.1 cysteine desulfurase [Persicimonas caeni]QED32956.1 cysteine desulfurase [Persicimonas caeni]
MNPIYLDYNATTPLLPEVVDAMLPYLREHFGNPSSSHVYGKRARRAVDQAREQVAEFIGCWPEEVVFTGGGTEANNLAIRGAARAAAEGRRHIVTSSVEHPAVEKPCAWLEGQGWRVTRLEVDATGCVDLGHAAEVIDDECALVTVMHANNEVGTIQPVDELAEFAHAHGAVFHTDAAQSLGKIWVRVEDLGLDLMTIAGHKLYAPKGVGALFVREMTPLEAVTFGADHEGGLRPGTENVASIVGLGKACELAHKSLDEAADEMRRLRDALWARLSGAVSGITVNGDLDNCLPNTLNVRFPGVMGQDVLAAADEVAASTGSACHEGEVTISRVLEAMGVAEDEAVGSVRLSLGRQTTMDEVERAAEALVGAWRGVSASS